MDPYEVLGLSPTASWKAVKARYRELALQLHPDKAGPEATEEELRTREERFKHVACAYKVLEDRHRRGDTSSSDPAEEWRSAWKMFQDPRVWEGLGTLFRGIHEQMQKTSRTHKLKLPVSLEDIAQRRQRRVRMFLTGFDEPIFVAVDCGSYPEAVLDRDGHEIRVALAPQPHPVYRADEYMGTLDLYATIEIRWDEYLAGCTRHLPCLLTPPPGPDARIDDDAPTPTFPFAIPPFCRLDGPIVVPGRGLAPSADLLVRVSVVPPPQGSSTDAVERAAAALRPLYPGAASEGT